MALAVSLEEIPAPLARYYTESCMSGQIHKEGLFLIM